VKFPGQVHMYEAMKSW